MIFNPNARVRVARENGRATGVAIQAPIRGRGLLVHDIQGDDETLFPPLLQFFERRSAPLAEERPLLQRVGLLIDEAERSERVTFEARLDSVAGEDGGDAAVEVAGELVLQEGTMPAPWGIRTPAEFGQARPVAWHRDTRTGIVCAYWPDEALAQELRRLAQRRQATVSPAVRAALRGSGIIAEDIAVTPRAACAEQLEERGYAVIRALFPVAFHRAVDAYIAELIDNGWCLFAPEVGRFIAHNEPVCHFLLETLADPIARAAGAPLKPSYTYLSAYREAAALAEHRDRPQCEYTVSLLLRYEPLDGARAPWPLLVRAEGETEPTELYHGIGDAVIFRGRRLYHSRPRLPEGHRATFLLFHYVAPDFDDTLD